MTDSRPAEVSPARPSSPTPHRAPLLLAAGMLLLAAMAVAYTLGGRSASRPGLEPALPSRPAVPTPAPEFALQSLRGPETIALSQFRGQVVVLNFFASWCGPCALEAADLQRTWEETRAHGVVFLGVAIQDEYGNAKAFLDRHRVGYPAAFDAEGAVSQLYRITGIPTTVVIDPEGRILARHAGIFVGDEGRARLRALIDGARAGRP